MASVPSHTLPQSQPTFQGFPDFRSNVTYTPIQVFTVVLPNSSRGCVRIVLYMMRRILGWVDENGNPVEEQLKFSLNELANGAGVSRRATIDALREAIANRYVNCLQTPRPKTVGDAGCSGVYELRWCDDHYTNNLDEFTGFYYKQSYIGPGGEPWASRKNIPNDFFDVVVKQERLAVIRIVSCLLFYSIAWGAGGERQVKVKKSYRELAQLTQIDRSTVWRALEEAVAKGYIHRTVNGTFDTSAQNHNESSEYAIFWRKRERNPVSVQKCSPTLVAQERCKNAARLQNGAKMQPRSVQKDNTERCKNAIQNGAKMQSENRCKNAAPYKEIKQERKTTTSRADDRSQNQHFAAAVFLLTESGLDEGAARLLAKNHALEDIQNQIDALPRRNPTANPPGMLRKSIQENWPLPQQCQTSDAIAERKFCEGFYASFNGNQGRAIAEATQTDIKAASKLIGHFKQLSDPDSLGRKFGSFAKSRKPDLTSCAQALRVSGDAFIASLKAGRNVKSKQPQPSHRDRAKQRYHTYLKESETRLRQQQPELYGAFIAYREQASARNPVLSQLSGAMRQAFESEGWRLSDFEKFIEEQQIQSVLSFHAWQQHAQRTP